MKRNIIYFLVIIVAFFFLFSCNKAKKTDSIYLTVDFSTPHYSDTFTDITYHWYLKKHLIQYNPDYKVFVHFWRDSKKMMLLQDDHDFPWNIENWKPGKELSYTHKDIYIPDFIDDFDLESTGKETITFTVGIWNPKVKNSKIVLYQKKLDFELRPAEYPELTYAEGWYPEEKFGYGIYDSWRWTAKKASIIADNVGQPLYLYIYGGVDKGVYPDQKVTIKINDKELETFIPKEGKFKRKYLLDKKILGQEDEFKIYISTDKTFVPTKVGKGKDDRELGVQIYLVNLMPVKTK